MTDPIYWDNAATTRPFPALSEPAWLASLPWGNPSSVHGAGLAARTALDAGRDVVRRALGTSRGSVVITSGGSEANRVAVLGVAALPPRPGNVVLNRVEHPSVRGLAGCIEQLGVEVRWAPNDRYGRIDPDRLGQLVDEFTMLVSVQAVNNELGTVQPLADIVKVARLGKKGVQVHVDAVQGFLKVPLDVEALGVDLLSLSAHKIHGPKGVGALWVREPRRVKGFCSPGSHEDGLRGGTQNVPGFLAFVRAIGLWQDFAEMGLAEMRRRRARFVSEVLARIPRAHVNGGPDVAPHIANISFPGARAELLLHALDDRGVLVSAGAACKAGDKGPTDVLKAVGHTEDLGTLRFSWGLFHDDDEVERVLAALEAVVAEVREVSA
jgi:cysteine desulfurase